MTSRRSFVSACSAALTCAVLPKSLFAQSRRDDVFSNAALGAYQQGTMTQAAFEKVVGSSFTAFLDDDRVAYLRLESVETPKPTTKSSSLKAMMVGDVMPAEPTRALETFSLHFAISGPAFPQATYLLDHGTMGRFSIFLVPGFGTATCTATICRFKTA